MIEAFATLVLGVFAAGAACAGFVLAVQAFAEVEQ